jgi:hypothetical protein
MKTLFKGSLLAILGLCLGLYATAQVQAQGNPEKSIDTTTSKKTLPFDLNMQIRNVYIWRGFKVSNSPMTNVNMQFNLTKDKSLTAGFWGAGSFNGEYKEFDYFVSYAKKGLSLSIWDVNNFSDYPDANIFSYNPKNTSHFIDVRAGYDFGDAFPLSVQWTTIILGRDTHVKSNGDLSNSYSNYTELGYRLWKDGDAEIHAFVGGGFAFGRQANFYGSKPNIVNTGITLNKNLVIFKYRIPLAATAMFNPEKKYGALQLVANIF